MLPVLADHRTFNDELLEAARCVSAEMPRCDESCRNMAQSSTAVGAATVFRLPIVAAVARELGAATIDPAAVGIRVAAAPPRITHRVIVRRRPGAARVRALTATPLAAR